MDNTQPTRQGFLPWHLSWLTVVLAIITIGTFIAISGPDVRYATPLGGVRMGNTEAMPPVPTSVPTAGVDVSSGAGQSAMSPDRYPYPYISSSVSAGDTREFLKIYYNASMRTRDVAGLTASVETTVHGFGGRIDQESVSPQYSSVSFSVPQAKYDAFRAQLESLVGSRFISVTISSQNMLPQKVNIEEQQKQADTMLATYTAARKSLVAAHTAAVQALQAKIDADEAQLATLRSQPSTVQIVAQIQQVSYDWAQQKQQLADENASYTKKLSNADSNITYAQTVQKAVQTQNQALLDSVATVTGTVSIQWISLWDIAQLYLPGYWIPFIFAALTVLSFLRDRRRAAAPAL